MEQNPIDESALNAQLNVAIGNQESEPETTTSEKEVETKTQVEPTAEADIQKSVEVKPEQPKEEVKSVEPVSKGEPRQGFIPAKRLSEVVRERNEIKAKYEELLQKNQPQNVNNELGDGVTQSYDTETYVANIAEKKAADIVMKALRPVIEEQVKTMDETELLDVYKNNPSLEKYDSEIRELAKSEVYKTAPFQDLTYLVVAKHELANRKIEKETAMATNEVASLGGTSNSGQSRSERSVKDMSTDELESQLIKSGFRI